MGADRRRGHSRWMSSAAVVVIGVVLAAYGRDSRAGPGPQKRCSEFDDEPRKGPFNENQHNYRTSA